jgi:hypothetical protein
MPDSLPVKMGELRDSPLDEEISTIFIVGFPDDITVSLLLSFPRRKYDRLIVGTRIREHVSLRTGFRGVVSEIPHIPVPVQ